MVKGTVGYKERLPSVLKYSATYSKAIVIRRGSHLGLNVYMTTSPGSYSFSVYIGKLQGLKCILRPTNPL